MCWLYQPWVEISSMILNGLVLVNLTGTRVTQEEETSVKKLPPRAGETDQQLRVLADCSSSADFCTSTLPSRCWVPS